MTFQSLKNRQWHFNFDWATEFEQKRRLIIDIEAKRTANENHLYLLKDMLNEAYARGKALHEEKMKKTGAIMVRPCGGEGAAEQICYWQHLIGFQNFSHIKS